MGRLIAHYRYLLLAFLVLALGIAMNFLLGPRPAPRNTGASLLEPPVSVSLRERYEQIQVGMTRAQVLEILGKPKTVTDLPHDMGILCTWQEGRDAATILLLPGGDYRVMSKTFFVDGVKRP